MSDRIDHAAVSEDYHLTPETLAGLRLLLDDAPQLPYRASPRTHGNPSDGPTYVALEAQLEGRWEEVATGCYDRWSDMGLGLAAAAINALPALLDTTDELAHMTEARDNARAEVERLTALLAEADEPHPDRPNCTMVGGKGVRVTATDLETGESESVVIDNDYVLICAEDRYQSGVQRHASGTTVLTVKVRKHLAALDGDAEGGATP